MATFCKTSQGGINLEQVTDWFIGNGILVVMLVGKHVDDCVQIPSTDPEAKRFLDILNGVCIFDTTQERAK